MQFDWERHKPPSGRLSFGLFFRPILWRLKPAWWACNYWPLQYPVSEDAELALSMIEDGLAPPDTVLPAHAVEIVGDRDDFYGVLSPPDSADTFYTACRSAGMSDNNIWMRMTRGTISTREFERSRQEYERHVREHGTATDRFLEEYPVEFAFMTNDTVWWFAAREPAVLDELRAYAASVPGMSCQRTIAFGF